MAKPYPITVERSEIMRVEVTMDTQNTEPKKGHKKTQPKSGKPKGEFTAIGKVPVGCGPHGGVILAA